ncbi:hypothetical protein E5983_04215 [Streptococcus danieliae]|uniref:Transposase IS204/IS1001/IS1096/IS1165 DDE domain-containing protein n=1 Tax=Streptococcus danieliae TaxID=747656 RepID=A0A7X3G884_9STRE|nr:transposase [Streptococcus danieliae]MVX58852.1 hypothetical protein [Streptococcus danieliae]
MRKIASICKTGYQIVYGASLELAKYVNNLAPRTLPRVLAKEESIGLALSVLYHNGLVEGINNKIKLLKRSAFGYRKHEHLFARTYWMQTAAVHSI